MLSAYEEGIKPLLPIEEMFSMEQEFHRSLIVPQNDHSTSQQFRRSTTSATDEVSSESQSKAVQIKHKHSVSLT